MLGADDDQIREIIGSLLPPGVKIPPVNVEHEGKVQKVPEVFYEAAIALIKGEDLTSTATSWRESTNHYSENWTVLFILMLAVECQELGSFFIDVGKGENDQSVTYFNVVRALARRVLGIPESSDKGLIDKHVKPSHYINLEHLTDVQKAMNEIVEHRKKTASPAAEAAGLAEAEPTRKKSKLKKTLEYDLLPKISLNTRKTYQEILEMFNAPSMIISGPHAGKGEREVTVEDMVPIPKSYTGSTIMNKVTMTVAPCKNVRKEVVGYLIRFLVHDARWNPGQMIYRLIDEANLREKNKANANFKDPWPQYRHLQGTKFPLFNMTWQKWLKCCYAATGEKPDFRTFNEQMGQLHRADARSSQFHPFQVASLQKALARLRKAGALVGTEDEFRDENCAKWPFQAFRYNSMQVFWDSDKHLGLAYQFFPGALQKFDYFTPKLLNSIKNNPILSRADIRELIPQFDRYKTNNLLIHTAVEADNYEDDLDKLLETDYDKYCERLEEVTSVFMQKFQNIVSFEGNIDDLNISQPVKAAIKWMLPKLADPFTREVELYDPDLDFYGNMVVKHLEEYFKFYQHAQPTLGFKIRGLWSVYQRREGQLLYNLMVVGDAQKGKSFGTTRFAEKNFIPGTTKKLDRTTDAADQTDLPVHDEIRLINEAEDMSSVSGKDKAKKNLKKTALTEGEINVKTLEFQTIPGVGKIRASRDIKQPQGYTECNASNDIPAFDDPLASRYHIIIVGNSKIPIGELRYNVKKEDKKRLQLDFQHNQFGVMMMEKAMMNFAIPCRSPNLQMFRDVTARMVDILKVWGVLNENVDLPRAEDILAQFLRIIVIEKALLHTFHIRGAPHYGKPYRHEYLKDAAPYLYADTNDILLTWTLHSSEYIRSDYENVLKAACQVVMTQNYDTSKTPYDYYSEDFADKIRFKRDRNLNHRPEDGKANKEVIDLNYLEIMGSHAEVARSISHLTNPPLSPKEVLEILNQLNRHSFKPRIGLNLRNGYQQGLLCDDLKRHKLTKVPKYNLNKINFRNQISLFCDSLLTVSYLDVLMKIKELHPDRFRSPDQGKMLLQNYSSLDILMLKVVEFDSTLETLQMTTYNLKKRTVDDSTFSEEQAMRLCKAFVDIPTHNIKDPFQEISFLNYQEAVLILFGLEFGWIMEQGNLVTTFMKPSIIKDEIGKYERFASEDDILMLFNVDVGPDGNHILPIVDLNRKNRVCFSPMAIEMFDKNLILSAFNYAVLNLKTRPGKRMLGWADERYPTCFQTMSYTEESIRAKTQQFDDDMAHENATFRSEGIVFKRRDNIEPHTAMVLYGLGQNLPEHHKNKNNIKIVNDLDHEAALEQHRICGRPMSEPVRDPAWIRQNYLKNGGKVGKVNYPDSIIDDRKKNEREFWTPILPSMNSKYLAKSN